MTEDKKQINVFLGPDSVAELEEIKAYYSFNANSDAMRYLIRKECRSIRAQLPLPLGVEAK